MLSDSVSALSENSYCCLPDETLLWTPETTHHNQFIFSFFIVKGKKNLSSNNFPQVVRLLSLP